MGYPHDLGTPILWCFHVVSVIDGFSIGYHSNPTNSHWPRYFLDLNWHGGHFPHPAAARSLPAPAACGTANTGAVTGYQHVPTKYGYILGPRIYRMVWWWEWYWLIVSDFLTLPAPYVSWQSLSGRYPWDETINQPLLWLFDDPDSPQRLSGWSFLSTRCSNHMLGMEGCFCQILPKDQRMFCLKKHNAESIILQLAGLGTNYYNVSMG